MFSLYHKIDSAIIKGFQEGYLWLLDRTGVYVGTIQSICMVLIFGPTVVSMETVWMKLLVGSVLIVMMVTTLPNWFLQHIGNDKLYNAMAMRWEANSFRHMLMAVQATLSTIAVLMAGSGAAASSFVWFAVFYLECVKIRERNKKPFFESAPKMATQEGGA